MLRILYGRIEFPQYGGAEPFFGKLQILIPRQTEGINIFLRNTTSGRTLQRRQWKLFLKKATHPSFKRKHPVRHAVLRLHRQLEGALYP